MTAGSRSRCPAYNTTLPEFSRDAPWTMKFISGYSQVGKLDALFYLII
jgi:hypothetical protein